jgi:tetratricopeptide (TPR) repeat protein
MPDRPTVGLALIARNEEKNLPALLESVQGAFDQVALLDTGSKDKTVEVFRTWAADEVERQKENPDLCRPFVKVGHFEWCDDFSAARMAAHALLETDWHVWADCDDIIRGAEQLRGLAAAATPETAGYVFGYDYAHDEHGNCLCYLKRERLVRREFVDWDGKVHEAMPVRGYLQQVPAEMAEWYHAKTHGPDSTKRNLRILRAWHKEEPENPRVLAYLGTEELTRGKHKRAMTYFRRYLKLKTGWDEERAQIHRKYAVALITEERFEEAKATAFEALAVMPSWPDSYLTLAEVYYQAGEPHKAIEWATQALQRGMPDTLLIVNPLDYSFQPRLVLAAAYGAVGMLDDAIAAAEEALQIVPGHAQLLEGYSEWRTTRKREATAKTFVGAAELLVQHDEQLKALELLENTVPYFARDHAEVVAMRSALRERVRPLLGEDYVEVYRDGGEKPEVPVPDDKLMAFAGGLPRCQFLLEGLQEQLEGAPA